MELLKRYIAAVQRHLPDDKKDEIGRELEANIRDQLDSHAEREALTEDAVAAVLKQMGHPKQVALEFVPPKPLISTNYLPTYKYTIYVVLGVLFVIQVIDSTIGWMSADFGLVLYIKSILSGIVRDGCFAFTAITLTYILISAKNTGNDEPQKQSWQPQNLPAVGPSWQNISLQDIFTDLATYAFLLSVIWYPVLFNEQHSSWFTDSTLQVLMWASPLIIGGIALTLWQLKERYWNRRMQWINIVLNSGFVIILLYLAMSGLVFDTQSWGRVIELGIDNIPRAISVTLVIIACFPAYEILRDSRRLYLTR